MTPMPGQRMPIGGVPGTLPELPPTEAIFDAVEAATNDIHLTIFGEWIWYKPRKGAPIKIKANVDRGQGEELSGGPRQRQMPMKIQVKPNADDGIDPDTWTAMDEVVVHETRKGNKERTLVLRKIVGSEGGFITFEAS